MTELQMMKKILARAEIEFDENIGYGTGSSVEVKLEMAANMTGATFAFQAFDDDAYAKAVNRIKELLEQLSISYPLQIKTEH